MQIPILALSVLLIYLLWGQILPLLASGGLLLLALLQVQHTMLKCHIMIGFLIVIRT